jgi:hypothetical protein
MAAPGHPAMALLCERLSKQATATFTSHRHQQLMDTLERTGPGLFTDVVNEWNDGGDHGDWGRIVVLPRSAFGRGIKIIADEKSRFNFPSVYILHHFAGSWKPEPLASPPRRAWFESRKHLDAAPPVEPGDDVDGGRRRWALAGERGAVMARWATHRGHQSQAAP